MSWNLFVYVQMLRNRRWRTVCIRLVLQAPGTVIRLVSSLCRWCVALMHLNSASIIGLCLLNRPCSAFLLGGGQKHDL